MLVLEKPGCPMGREADQIQLLYMNDQGDVRFSYKPRTMGMPSPYTCRAGWVSTVTGSWVHWNADTGIGWAGG